MPLPPLAEPQAASDRVLAAATSLPVAGALFGSLIAINAVQTGSLAIRPLSRHTFRRVNRFVADTWWGWCVEATESRHGTRLVVTGDDVPMRENAIVVANHQEMPDITVLMAYARTRGRLGDLKWFVKDPIKYVPGIGWGMLFLDCLFVKRDWSDDRASIEATFERITRDKVPLWLVSFVEGTRIQPEKLAASQRFARERGLNVPQHTLVPRTKGFAATVTGLRHHVDAIYDFTIGYVDGVPTLWQFVKGYVKRIHLHVRRYPMAEIPETPEGMARWLQDRFVEKDALLAHYYEHGVFPGPAQNLPFD